MIQYATARVGAILVNINPAYQAGRTGVRPAPVRRQRAAPRPGLPPLDYAPMLDGRPAALPRPAQVVLPRRGLGRLLAGEVPRPTSRRREARLCSSTTRSTSSTPPAPPASPRARRSRTTTSSTTAYFVGERPGLHRSRPRLHPGPLYHCFGMVLGNLACTSHGACMVVPGRLFDPRPYWRPSRRSAARRCTACRRCSRRAGSSPPSTDYDLTLAAHRHHGRLALSGRGDEAGVNAAAHARGGHRLRHDGDLAGLDPDPLRRLAGAAGHHRRPGDAARRDQDPRPGHRAVVPRGSPASSARAATA